MTRNKKFTVGILLFLMIASYYAYDQYEYSKTHVLYDIDDIYKVNSSYHNMDTGEVIHIDADDNATYIEFDDVGYIVDNEVLYQVLDGYESVRTRNDYFPYQSEEIQVEFSLSLKGTSRHFLLGEFCVWYESSDDKIYDIINGSELLDEIIKLIDGL